MRPHPVRLAPLVGLLLAACAAAPETTVAALGPAEDPAHAAEPAPSAIDAMPCVLDGAGVFYVASEDPARPRIRYADGQVGMSDHCAIRVANQLNRRIPPVYVNGRPIGFC